MEEFVRYHLIYTINNNKHEYFCPAHSTLAEVYNSLVEMSKVVLEKIKTLDEQEKQAKIDEELLKQNVKIEEEKKDGT